jgi:uncharacterized membrane protein
LEKLDFQLAADIVETTISPTFRLPVQLGTIAIIWTILNSFCSKELWEIPDFIKKNTGKVSKTEYY